MGGNYDTPRRSLQRSSRKLARPIHVTDAPHLPCGEPTSWSEVWLGGSRWPQSNGSMFENILKWRLLSGSHKFPGPDGGTCVNEAAIVAAGLEYRADRRAEDCPPCFSRVIAGFAIELNESMPDDLRQLWTDISNVRGGPALAPLPAAASVC